MSGTLGDTDHEVLTKNARSCARPEQRTWIAHQEPTHDAKVTPGIPQTHHRVALTPLMTQQ